MKADGPRLDGAATSDGPRLDGAANWTNGIIPLGRGLGVRRNDLPSRLLTTYIRPKRPT